MKNRIAGSIFSSSNRLTCLLNFLIKILNQKCHGYTHMLTIRQRRRPWQCRWKIDFASFQFFARLFQETQLLKRREFGLELKRRDCTQALTKIVEFMGLPFPFPSKLKIWSFHVLVMRGLQRNVQKSVMHLQSCCFVINPVAFLTLPLPSRAFVVSYRDFKIQRRDGDTNVA